MKPAHLEPTRHQRRRCHHCGSHLQLVRHHCCSHLQLVRRHAGTAHDAWRRERQREGVIVRRRGRTFDQQTVSTDTYVAATTATTMAARMPTTATRMTAASKMHSATNQHGAASAGEGPPLPPCPPLPPLVSRRRSHRYERQPKQPSIALPSKLKQVNVVGQQRMSGFFSQKKCSLFPAHVGAGCLKVL